MSSNDCILEVLLKQQKSGAFIHNTYALLAALIWGLAFSAQSSCLKAGMGNHTINAFRGWIAVCSLIVICFVFANPVKTVRNYREERKPLKPYLRKLLEGGFYSGLFLYLGTALQQYGLAGSPSGKSGFITALYLVLVPALGPFFKKKNSLQVWISVLFAMAGMFFLCFNPSESLGVSHFDLFLLSCAFMFTFQIYVIDYYTQFVDSVQFSLVQFIFFAVIGTVVSLIVEGIDWKIVGQCLPLLLYLGVCSSGIAYTFQILAQKDSNPAIISVLLSMESVFSVLGGAVFLKEILTPRQYLGCGIMLIAVILTQLPLTKIFGSRQRV